MLTRDRAEKYARAFEKRPRVTWRFSIGFALQDGHFTMRKGDGSDVFVSGAPTLQR
jgi:hypothetical protein